MKKSKFKSVLVGSMTLLLALTSCAIPGQEQAPVITFGGLAAKALKAFDSVNVKATITAIDQNNKSYIGDVVAESDSTGCVMSKGVLSLHPDYNKTEITTPVVCNVEFSLITAGKGFKATKSFYFTEGATSIAFNGAGNTVVKRNREFDVMKDVKAIADNSRDVTQFVTVTAEGAEIVNGKLDTSVVKDITLTYTAEFAGITQEVTRVVKISEDLFGNDLTDSSFLNVGKGENELVSDSHINFWWVAGADWNCGPVVDATASIKDGKFDVQINNLNGNTNDWSVQFFYLSDEMTETADYVLTFDVNAENARKFKLNGVEYTLVAGENHITIPAANILADASYKIAVQIGNFGGTDTGLYSFSNFKIAKVAA